MINKRDYVELGLGCIDICTALERGMGGKKPDDLSPSVCEAINQFTTWVKTDGTQFGWFTDDALVRRTVGEIREKIIKRNERNAVSRLVHAKNDKERIGAWKLDLIRILQVFNVRLATSLLGCRQLFPFRPSWP